MYIYIYIILYIYIYIYIYLYIYIHIYIFIIYIHIIYIYIYKYNIYIVILTPHLELTTGACTKSPLSVGRTKCGRISVLFKRPRRKSGRFSLQISSGKSIFVPIFTPVCYNPLQQFPYCLLNRSSGNTIQHTRNWPTSSASMTMPSSSSRRRRCSGPCTSP